MAQLAIKGHPTRGNEVIEILEMLGGINEDVYNGKKNAYYFINDNYIDWCHECDPESNYINFTLEEFLKKFQYKVGDKVIYQSEVFPIIGMKWSCSNNTVIYTMKSNYGTIDCYDSTWMKPYKEETMEETIKIDIPKGYEFTGVDDNQQVIFTKIQPQYPKTYDECCETLSLGENGKLYTKGYKASLVQDFHKLLICREAYWKIAGDWEEKRKEKVIHYVIYSTLLGEVVKDATPNSIANYLLDFPTAEMREAFYKNFKELIESCKELL